MLTYEEHYLTSKQHYEKLHGQQSPILDLYNLGMKIFQPYEKNEFFVFSTQYDLLIKNLSEKIDTALKDPSNHFSTTTEYGGDLATKLSNIWNIPEIETLANIIMPQLEKSVFSSFLVVNSIHIYRNNIHSKNKERSSSWLWHWDNTPKEDVKLLVYLTDVDEHSAPFEYIRNIHTKEAIKMPSTRVSYKLWRKPAAPYINTRMPDLEVKQLLDSGDFETYKIVGKKGTVLFFDNNILHRANIATSNHRDVIIFKIRPYHLKLIPWVSKEHTGSWMHAQPNIDPENIKPILRRT